MQLLAIVLYSRWGDRRILELRPGRLNVVTGQSKTGKSALLDIVEFCLGRSTVTMPVGPITTTISWYAVLVQLTGGVRAFVARPSVRQGAATTQQGMLEVGANLEPLDFAALKVNADAGSIRSQLGALIGIEENLNIPEPGSVRPELEANLGHALLLCLQGQSEIANRSFLFHRQGEEGIAGAIQDTLPYFLGAVPADQARKRQVLESTRRDLKRAETELQTAEQAANQLDVRVRAAVAEGYSAGLVTQSVFPDRTSALAALTAAVVSQPTEAVLDDEIQGRLRELERRRSDLRRELREAAEVRSMLLAESQEEGPYSSAVGSQVDRLASVELLPSTGNDNAAECPICGSVLNQLDPTSAELRTALLQVRSQLADIEAARPKLRDSLRRLDDHITNLRDQLRALEQGAAELAASLAPTLASRAEERAFSRGRLDVLLRALRPVDAATGLHLRQRVAGLRSSVERLEAELSPDDEREQVTSRLLTVGADMTTWAEQLRLEHAGRGVRLDLRRLTVIADTESGPAPMSRIGSAENWIGYHLIAHLALHRFFVRQNRPVPHLLMLDQPTQAYYPSEVEQLSGVPTRDEDRLAVRRLYELLRAVVAELNPQFQVIVCDHANLDEPWFQASVAENWRNGAQLVPEEWITRASLEGESGISGQQPR
jgi:septal ring factor EnvC (AmiA/AmiB activator)